MERNILIYEPKLWMQVIEGQFAVYKGTLTLNDTVVALQTDPDTPIPALTTLSRQANTAL